MKSRLVLFWTMAERSEFTFGILTPDEWTLIVYKNAREEWAKRDEVKSGTGETGKRNTSSSGTDVQRLIELKGEDRLNRDANSLALG